MDGVAQESVDHDQSIEVVIRILKSAVTAGATSLHLRGHCAPLVRVNGELHELEHPEIMETFIDATLRSLGAWAGVDRAIVENPQVGFTVEVPELGFFRVHGYQQRAHRSLVIKPIPSEIPSLASLRLPPIAKKIAGLEKGLVLLSGGVRSGKSSTFSSILNFINFETTKHIVTIESPISFILPDELSVVSQKEVGRDVQDVEGGIRSALHEDPDVICVDSISTLDEFELALSAAEAGHLVLAVVHGMDVGNTFLKLVQSFPEDHQASARHRIADVLSAMIVHKLLPKRGDAGKILVTEILTRSKVVQSCLKDPNRFQGLSAALDASSQDYGSHSFNSQLVRMMRDGLIEQDMVKSVSNDPNDLFNRPAFRSWFPSRNTTQVRGL